MKVVMKVCLSEMYLYLYVYRCHYYCVTVRNFKHLISVD